jgi:chaperonin cofactor prefoldin
VGVLSGSVVAYLGKRGENANARMVAEMDQVQEERDRMMQQRDALQIQVSDKDKRIEELLEQRLADRETIARLRVRIVEMGGDPS